MGIRGRPVIGVVIEDSVGAKIRIARWIGRHDNNVAEYVALLEALQCAVELKAKTLHVYSDSEVVVRQMKGEYDCRNAPLFPELGLPKAGPLLQFLRQSGSLRTSSA